MLANSSIWKGFKFLDAKGGNPDAIQTLHLTTSKGSLQVNIAGAYQGESFTLNDNVLNGVSSVTITSTLANGTTNGSMLVFFDDIVLDNITLPAADHAPTLNATAANPGFTEGGRPSTCLAVSQPQPTTRAKF